MDSALRSGAPLLERDADLTRLEGVLAGALAGRGGLVLIEGAAGVGKTSVLTAARGLAGDTRATVLSAVGAELESNFAFGVCHQLLDARVAELSEQGVQVFEGAAARARALFDPDAPPPEAPAGDPLFATIHGLYWLLAGLAERSPLLLLIDDAQWSDLPSLRFLDYLVRRLDGMPVALVLAVRTGEPESEQEMIASLRAQPGVSRLEPAPLSPNAVTLMVRERVPDAPDSLCRACAEATGGNPFYLRELLEDQDLVEAQGPAAGIESISRHVLARLARLGPQVEGLASATAILGDNTPLRRATELATLDADAAARAADALVAAEILRIEAEGDGVGFVHPIVRQAVYGQIPAGRRAAGHAQAAAMLEAEGAAVGAIASQLAVAERRGEPWAVEALRKAAADANRSGAPEIAAGYLRRALEEPPPPGDRAGLLLDLGVAEMLSGDPAAIEHLKEALKLAEAPGERAGAAASLAASLAFLSRVAEGATVLKQVIEEIKESEPVLAAWLSSELIVMGLVDLRARELLADELDAVRSGYSSNPDAAAASALAVLSFDALVGGTADEAAGLAERALEGGALLDSLPMDHSAVFFSVSTLLVTDRGDAAEAYLRQAADRAAALGSVRAFGAVSTLRARSYYRWGRVTEAEEEARLAVPLLEEHGWKVGMSLAVAALVDPLLEQGELAEAARVLGMIDPNAEDPDAHSLSQWRHSRSQLLLAVGRPEEALEEAIRCGEWEQRWLASTSPFSQFSWRATAAQARLAMDQADEARELAEEGTARARAFGDPHALGASLRVEGLTHDGDARIERLRESIQVLEPSCSRLEYAKALADLGTALRLGRQRREAREPLSEALDLAYRCGATVLAERAGEELEISGARPRQPMLSGVDSLTPSERRVATMASEGLSNPEIAQSLFVTRKTVEMHLSNAYRKLEVGGRDELSKVLSA